MEELRVGGSWRTTVVNEADRLDLEIQRLPASQSSNLVQGQIKQAVASARALASTSGTPLTWWTGALAERSWAALGEAREGLLLVEPDEVLEARLPELIRFGTAESVAGPDLEQKLKERPLDRAWVRQLWQRHNVERDANHAAARSFRNFLFLLAAALSLGITLWAATDSSKRAVIGIGVIAGLFTTITSLTSASQPSGPYALAPAQALLKAAAGGAAALLGVLLVARLPGAQEPSGSSALFYGAVFGTAQKAVTQLADKQADGLVGKSIGHSPAATTSSPQKSVNR